ncbi:MAG: amidohydrolase family protein [Verrucomicrobiae bacterium]|nr:amidohydrolase family protein [Verrucomicrobiae bacterium]
MSSPPPIDIHVHLVGNGTGHTGCELHPRGWRQPLDMLMLKCMGLPLSALKGDLDRLYRERLLQLVRESSLAAAVILPHERAYDEQGRVIKNHTPLYVPNDYALKLGRKHPEFLPAVSIHPARPDAMEELERCLEGGAVLYKCLPNSQNIDCNNRRYTRFWERVAEAGLPMLAHTAGEHTVPVIRPDLGNPRVLERPLQCGVTVIAAHAATKSGLFDPDYFHFLVEMMNRHPRLYADISAFNIPIRGQHIPECLRGSLSERLVHGSDFPVPIFGHWSWARGLVDWKSFRRWEQHPNPLERDYQLKRAMGFPDAVFNRIHSILRKSACESNRQQRTSHASIEN